VSVMRIIWSISLWAWALVGAPTAFAVAGRSLSLAHMLNPESPSEGPWLLALFTTCIGSGALAFLMVAGRNTGRTKKIGLTVLYIVVAGFVSNFARGMLIMSALNL
jgi:hypothetical protein